LSRSPAGWRARITDTTVGLFGHAPDPLSDTFTTGATRDSSALTR